MGRTSANIRRERTPKAGQHDQRYGSEKVTECRGHRQHCSWSGRKHIHTLKEQEVRSEKLWGTFKEPLGSSYRV